MPRLWQADPDSKGKILCRLWLEGWQDKSVAVPLGPILFENAAAVANAGHFGENGFSIRHPTGGGQLFVRAQFGNWNARLFDDEGLPSNHSTKNGAGLQTQFAKGDMFHMTH
jgi:hypothetical protein